MFDRLSLLFGLVVCVYSAEAQQQHMSKIADNISTRYTKVGKIGLTVTNFGTIGTRNSPWPNQPSCEYPLGSRIEHIYQGGLWVGAHVRYADSSDIREKSGEFFVSTGANDLSGAPPGGQGYEFTTEMGDTMTEISSLENDHPASAKYSVNAVSHEDFICNYSDMHTRVPATNDSILYHIPLKIKVHEEAYAWNFPFADYFVILRYVIRNASKDTLDSVYVGFWNNSVVRNTKLVRPGTPGYFDHGAFGYSDTLRMAYSFDFDGIPGGVPANSYIGLKLLGSTPFPSGVDSLGNMRFHAYYNAWRFRGSVGSANPWEVSPTYDYFGEQDNPYLGRYNRMAQSMPQTAISGLRTKSGNYTYLVSTGPFSRLNPNDSVEVVFAIVCAKKYGTDPAYLDTRVQRSTLYANAKWAQQAYDGEDANGNNRLDPGEDLNDNGILDRFTLPQPPHRPIVHAVVANQNVVIYWDRKTSEESVDPISHLKDFEGYRVYRSLTGSDFLSHEDFTLSPPLVGEFDRVDGVGFNTGLGDITLDSAITFEPDTIVSHLSTGEIVRCPGSGCGNLHNVLYRDTLRAVRYWYRFPPKGVTFNSLNGWQYVYGVSAFDSGDAVNKIPSLESAKSMVRAIPGTPPTSDKSQTIGVYPNPYYTRAYWDGTGFASERTRKIYFYNLPKHCDITVFTLAGDVVTVLHHDAATYDGSEIQWFRDFGDPSTKAQFAGGEHAWDMITRNDQAIATGLYLFTVKDQDTGDVKRGKFMVIK